MMECCLLGTGAMMPLPRRRLAAMMVKLNGRQLLIDCGEGTQVAIREVGWSFARIDAICVTHFHADHIAGLPGLLLSMGASGRTESVRLIGPRGLPAVVRCLRVIAPELPYSLTFEEIESPDYVTRFAGARLTCFKGEHIIPCYGYALALPRPGRFDPERARRLGIPISHWKALQSGERVQTDAGTFTPDMVLGPERKGIKLAYCTDTRPTEAIARYAEAADLFVCEGTYGDDEKADKADSYGHMTFSEAAALAARAGAKALVLTHFSPSMPDPEAYLSAALRVFADTTIGYDGLVRTLRFQEGVTRS